ncbi:MAG: hypothetical protein ACPGUD_01345 [Parashewanella sp.]
MASSRASFSPQDIEAFVEGTIDYQNIKKGERPLIFTVSFQQKTYQVAFTNERDQKPHIYLQGMVLARTELAEAVTKSLEQSKNPFEKFAIVVLKNKKMSAACTALCLQFKKYTGEKHELLMQVFKENDDLRDCFSNYTLPRDKQRLLQSEGMFAIKLQALKEKLKKPTSSQPIGVTKCPMPATHSLKSAIAILKKMEPTFTKISSECLQQVLEDDQGLLKMVLEPSALRNKATIIFLVESKMSVNKTPEAGVHHCVNPLATDKPEQHKVSAQAMREGFIALADKSPFITPKHYPLAQKLGLLTQAHIILYQKLADKLQEPEKQQLRIYIAQLESAIATDRATLDDKQRFKTKLINNYRHQGVTEQLLDLPAVKQRITNTLVYNCLHDKQCAHHLNNFAQSLITDFLQQVTALNSLVVSQARVAASDAQCLLNDEKKRALKQQLTTMGLLKRAPSFEDMLLNINPQCFLVTEPIPFVTKVWCFRQLQAHQTHCNRPELGRLPRNYVTDADLYTMVNHDVLVPSDVKRLKEDPKHNCFFLLKFILMQTPSPQMQAIGFTPWNNTCNFNTALQVLIRTLPPKLFKSEHLEPDGSFLCNSIRDMIEEGKSILNPIGGSRPRMFTQHQQKVFLACRYLAKHKKIDACFNVESIDKMKQIDTTELVKGMLTAVGLQQSPVFCAVQQECEFAIHNGKTLKRVTHNREKFCVPIINCFGLEVIGKKKGNQTSIRDWYDIFCEHPYPTQDINTQWEVLNPATQKKDVCELDTKKRYVQCIDEQSFKYMFLALDATGMPELAETARVSFKNSGETLTIPIVNKKGRFGNANLRLRVVVLHTSTSRSSAAGHFISATHHYNPSSPPSSFYTFQDDNRDLSFSAFIKYIDQSDTTGLAQRWTDIHKLIESKKYTPCMMVYELDHLDWE